MSWNGAGQWNRLFSWVADKAAAINITASRMDSDTNDITANGLGNCLTRDGQGFAVANLPMGGFRHTGTGAPVATTDYAQLATVNNPPSPVTMANLLTMNGAAINEAKTTLASAATVAIGAATGNYVEITGTTTITAFDTVQAGTRRIVKFDGALTLTNNNTSLILPGAASITTAAGDVAVFVSEGAGNWRCTQYMPAALSPATSGGLGTGLTVSGNQIGLTGPLSSQAAAVGNQGGCRLAFVSTTQMKLSPLGSALVPLNGTYVAIPSAGITAVNTNTFVSGVGGSSLAATQAYDVYLFNNGGTLALDFWPGTGGASTHMTDTTPGNVGVEVRNNAGSPDSTRTLVAKIRTGAAGVFQNNSFGGSVDSIFLINWFNRRPLSIQNLNTGNVAVSFASGNVSSSNGNFLTWGDCPIHGVAAGLIETNTNGSGGIIACGIDATVFGCVTEEEIVTSGLPASVAATGVSGAAEGFHTFQTIGGAIGGGVVTYFQGDTGTTLSGIWG